MGYRESGKNRMLNHLVGNAETSGPITQMSLHTAFPVTDVNEVSGGSYARQALIFDVVASGGTIGHEQVIFEVPALTNINGIAYRAADGAIIADVQILEEAFNDAGQLTVQDTSYLDLNLA